MVKHVVMWRLKDSAEGNDKSTNLKLIKEKLYALIPVIPALESLEVGENMNPSEVAFDLVLITKHQDQKALLDYAKHPQHVEVAGFIGKVVSHRQVVDFEY